MDQAGAFVRLALSHVGRRARGRERDLFLPRSYKFVCGVGTPLLFGADVNRTSLRVVTLRFGNARIRCRLRRTGDFPTAVNVGK